MLIHIFLNFAKVLSHKPSNLACNSARYCLKAKDSLNDGCRLVQTDTNETELYVGDVHMDCPHEYFQEFRMRIEWVRIFFGDMSILDISYPNLDWKARCQKYGKITENAPNR